MGGSPHSDGPLEGARRELKEETGLIAETWTHLMKVHPSNSVTDESGFIYLATDLTLGETEHEDTEEIIVKRVPVEEAVKMAMTDQITDCMSVAALLRLNLGLQSGEITV